MPDQDATDIFRSVAAVVVATLFLLGGLFFVCVGGFTLRQSTPYPHGVRTAGTVSAVVLDEALSGRRSSTYEVTYTFESADGTRVTFSDLRSPPPEIGSRIDVSYEPARPQSARRIAESDAATYLGLAVGGAVTVAAASFVVRSAWTLARSRRRSRTEGMPT